MSTRADTWMKLYWGDYARDTGHLNALGHGAYLMLIKHYWCSGAPLKNDDDELWRIACCDSIREWRKVKQKIVRLFTIDGDLLRHKRVDAEISIANTTAEVKSIAGKKGAESRWAKPSISAKNHTENDSNRIVLPMPKQCGGNAASESESEKEKESTQTPSLEAVVERKIAPGEGWGSNPVPPNLTPLVRRPLQASDGDAFWLTHASRVEMHDPVTGAVREVAYPLEPEDRALEASRLLDGTPVSLKPVLGGMYLDRIGDEVCAAAGIRLETWRGDFSPLKAWLDAGIDYGATILPTIQRVAAGRNYPPSISSLKFFDTAVRDAHARRRAA